ncbi:MAG: VOC family protein [Promethearchaeota archaeon]|nr:MAG: VOC family protein [Candidatus Lokiarchaeota archaeon]
MKIDHIAVASNSIEASDRFFMELLGLKKSKTFTVSAELMEQFFGINKEHNFVRYQNDNLGVEVIISNENSKAIDVFTHSCLIVENREAFIKKSSSMGFKTIKVQRKDGEGYYSFVKDSFGNLYEIK